MANELYFMLICCVNFEFYFESNIFPLTKKFYFLFSSLFKKSLFSCSGQAIIQSHVEVRVSNAKGNLIKSFRRAEIELGGGDDYL